MDTKKAFHKDIPCTTGTLESIKNPLCTCNYMYGSAHLHTSFIEAAQPQTTDLYDEHQNIVHV